MSQFYVPGPAYVFTGTAADRAFEFYGFTERGLTLSRSGKYEDVNVDYAGAMPGDVAMLGQDARLSGDFTRYNEDVAERCACFIYGQQAGFGKNASVGTLMTLENGGFPVIVYCPYSAKKEYDGTAPGSSAAMTKLFYFPSTYVSDAIEATFSVRRKAPRISWRPIPIFGTYVSNIFQPGAPPFDAYMLYDTSPPPGITIDYLIGIVN